MGKTIVITGAGDGLGRALARRFAKDKETVILLGRTMSKVQAVADEIGAPHFALECDVANPDSVRAAFKAIAEKYPKIDVLINNAAVYEPFTLAEVTDAQITTQININLAGPIYCAREALPLLRGGGHIINVTSESTPLKMPMLWMYAGTKTALEYISDSWVRELEAEGVRVTVVQAGMMMAISGWRVHSGNGEESRAPSASEDRAGNPAMPDITASRWKPRKFRRPLKFCPSSAADAGRNLQPTSQALKPSGSRIGIK